VRKNNHGQNNQDFLDFLNLATAQIRALPEKQPGARHTTTKRDEPWVGVFRPQLRTDGKKASGSADHTQWAAEATRHRSLF
jgi:hypothetical protein